MEIDHCLFPDNLLYDLEEITWVKKDGDEVVLGVTCIYAFVAGRLAAVRFKPVGTVLEKGRSIAPVESLRFYGAVRTPVNGSLIQTKEALSSAPSLANRDPYLQGWFARIRLRPDSGIERLSSAGEAEVQLRGLIRGLRIRCFNVYPDYEISGIRSECPETLSRLDELLVKIQDDESVHLVTDNPAADRDVQNWVAIRDHRILDQRREGNLRHYILGR